MLSEPDGSAILGPLMSRAFMSGPLLTNIPYPELLVPRCCGQHGSIGIPRQALHNIGVFERVYSRPGANVPKLDGEISGGRGEDVFGGRVEENLADFSRMACQLGKGGNVGGLFGIGEQTESLGNLPQHDFGIVGSGGDHTVVEGVP